MKWHRQYCKKCDKTFRSLKLAKKHPHKTKAAYFTKTKRVRDVRGEKNGLSKLTEKDVRTIRNRYRTTGQTSYDLAQSFDVSQTCIWFVIKKLTWRHVR